MARLDGKKTAMWPWIVLVCVLVGLAVAGYFWYENREVDETSVDVTTFHMRFDNNSLAAVQSRSPRGHGVSQPITTSGTSQHGRSQGSPMFSLGATATSTGGQS